MQSQQSTELAAIEPDVSYPIKNFVPARVEAEIGSLNPTPTQRILARKCPKLAMKKFDDVRYTDPSRVGDASYTTSLTSSAFHYQ